MDKQSEANDFPGARGGVARQWAPWLIAAAAWVLHLLGGYLLVEGYCRPPGLLSALGPDAFRLLLHGLTLACLLAALGAAALARADLKRLRRLDVADRALSRRRFLDRGAVAFAWFIGALVLLEGWGNFLLEPCQ